MECFYPTRAAGAFGTDCQEHTPEAEAPIFCSSERPKAKALGYLEARIPIRKTLPKAPGSNEAFTARVNPCP